MDPDETTKAASPELGLDELMERIRAEVAERKKVAEGAAPVPKPRDEFPDFSIRHWTARDLLSLSAPDFSRAVHLAFLGREPTPDEFLRLRDRLLIQHVGRMRVLREFRRSAETRLRVEGFWHESIRDRLYWSPPAKFIRAVIRLIGNIYHAPRWMQEFVVRVELLERRSAEAAAAIRGQQSAQTSDRLNAVKQVRQVQDQVAATKQALDNVIATRAGMLESRIAGEISRVESRMTEIALKLVETRTDHWRAILDQKLRMETFLDTERAATTTANETWAENDKEKSHLLDPLYLSFEDRYRGTREDIKNRQFIYLERVSACVSETGHGAVIDIGCGRGEWLELLAESGIAALGYDLNRIAIQECRERGLDAHLADAIEILSALPNDSCSAITGFHIIEHLPFETLVKLLDHCLRVLRPGGLLVLETPNPANLVVAAETFYFDPTHRNPIPSELTSYLLTSRGFADMEILPLHPVGWPSLRVYEDPMLAYLQNKLFGPQDYAAIARKSD